MNVDEAKRDLDNVLKFMLTPMGKCVSLCVCMYVNFQQQPGVYETLMKNLMRKHIREISIDTNVIIQRKICM